MAGRVILVATPIGNLAELSPRAIDALASADVIACEDTRRTGRLLQHAGIERRARLVVVNEHTEVTAVGPLMAELAAGGTVVLVTDAGMPAVSDPGERLVRAAVTAGHDVSVVAGPSAAVAALAVSGLPTARWCFEGFLPRKGAGRGERLAALSGEPRTVVLYEAPHRLARSLADLQAALGGSRRVAVARELTKLHEEVWRGTLDEAVGWTARKEPRGEYVIVIAGAPEPPPAEDDDITTALRRRLSAGDDRKTAVATVAGALGVPKRRVYDAALRLHDGPDRGEE